MPKKKGITNPAMSQSLLYISAIHARTPHAWTHTHIYTHIFFLNTSEIKI